MGGIRETSGIAAQIGLPRSQGDRCFCSRVDDVLGDAARQANLTEQQHIHSPHSGIRCGPKDLQKDYADPPSGGASADGPLFAPSTGRLNRSSQQAAMFRLAPRPLR